MIHITYPHRICLDCKLQGKTAYVVWAYFTDVYWCGHCKRYVRAEHTALKENPECQNESTLTAKI